MNTTLTEPAAAAGPPPLSSGGRTAARAVLVTAAVVVLTGTVALLTVAAVGLSALRLVTDRHLLPTDMRELTVDTTAAPMAVRIVSDRNATEPRVDLRMVTSERSERQELTVTDDAGGTVLRVEGGAGFLAWGDPGEVTVTVPPELGRQLAVTVRQDVGVLLADADLDELTAATADGAVILRGSARRIEVRTEDGDIRARQPITVAESFSAATVDGDLQVRFADTPGRIDVSTGDGDISIALPPPGPYLVRAQSRSGDARVQVPQTTDPARAVAEVTARSDNGAVQVETNRSIGR